MRSYNDDMPALPALSDTCVHQHRGPVPTSLTRGRRVQHQVGGSRSLFESRLRSRPLQQRWSRACTCQLDATRPDDTQTLVSPFRRGSIGQQGQPDGAAQKTRVRRRLGPFSASRSGLLSACRDTYEYGVPEECVHGRVTLPAQILFVCHPSTSREWVEPMLTVF